MPDYTEILHCLKWYKSLSDADGKLCADVCDWKSRSLETSMDWHGKTTIDNWWSLIILTSLKLRISFEP